MSRRSRFPREKHNRPLKTQNHRRESDSKRSRTQDRWRSASTHILVELKEILIKNGGHINVTIIKKTLDIFKKISAVFGGTGYDEVFKIMGKVFEESIFSKEHKTFEETTKEFISTPYFQLYKKLLDERKQRRNTTATRPSLKNREQKERRKSPLGRSRSGSVSSSVTDNETKTLLASSSSGGELLQNYSQYQAKKINQMKKTMESKESALHDLQYDRYILNEENQDLKKNFTREKDTHSKAYSDLIKIAQRKDEEIKVYKEQILELVEYRRNIENSKLDYLNDKSTNTQLDHKNMFSTANQIRTLKKLHRQFELIENQRIDDYTNKAFALMNDKPNSTVFITEGKGEGRVGGNRSANLAIERRNLKEGFVNQVNLLTHQMNLLKDRIDKLVSGNSDITIDGRKLEIQAETSSDSQERREALNQRKKNFSFNDKTYRYRPFEMINPLNFQNKLEVYVKRRKSEKQLEEERKVVDRKEFSQVFNTSSDISQFGRRWARLGGGKKGKPQDGEEEGEGEGERNVRQTMGKRSTSSFTASLIQKLESGKRGKNSGFHPSASPISKASPSPKIEPYFYELFHREVLSVQKEKPTSIKIPEGVTEIRLQHSRYHHTLPHSNVSSSLYSKSQMMTNLAIFEKLKAPKPLPTNDPLWRYYIKKYGRTNIPPTPRKLSLKDIRECIFQVYLLEFKHPQEYGSFKEAPQLSKLLDIYLLKEYGVSEISQKVYYETIRSVQYFARDRAFLDIRAFHDCMVGRIGTVQGRCMSICWKFAEWIYRKESAHDVRVIVAEQKNLHIEDLREEFFPKLYKGVGLRDIDLIIEDLTTFYSRREEEKKNHAESLLLSQQQQQQSTQQPIITTNNKRENPKTSKIVRKKSFLMRELLEFLFFRIKNSREFWCRKFLDDQMKILEKVKIYKHEFSQVMAKIAPRFSGEHVDFRFDEMCKYQQGHQMDTMKLSAIFTMFNFSESYKNDKEV